MAESPRSARPPAAPQRDTPPGAATATLPDILRAAAAGLLGLALGLLPLASMFIVVNGFRLNMPDALSIPLSIAGVLFAGICAGYLAAYRLRPHGVRGRRLAGQLAVLFVEAFVILLVLVPNGDQVQPSDCPIGCFSGDTTIATMAMIGWPVAAVGALAGSHLFVRRLLERSLPGAELEIPQRSQ